MSTTSKVMYSMRGFFGVMNDTGKADPDWFNSFPAEAIEGLCRFFELFSVKNHFLKAVRKRISSWLPLSMWILVTSHLSMWIVMTMELVWGNKARFTSWADKVIGIWDHLVWVMGPSTAT
jgi:hypothetical protein